MKEEEEGGASCNKERERESQRESERKGCVGGLWGFRRKGRWKGGREGGREGGRKNREGMARDTGRGGGGLKDLGIGALSVLVYA